MEQVTNSNLNFKFIGTIVLFSALTYLAMHYAVMPQIDKE